MSKKRIYEYAKELNLKSKEIIDELKSMNVEVSNHMQALEDDQIKALDKKFKKEQNTDDKQNTQNNHQKSNNKQNQNNKSNQSNKEKQNNKGNQQKTNNQQKNQNKKNGQNNKGKQQNKNNKNNKNNKQQSQASEPKEMPSKITYQEGITVGELAEKLNVESSGIIKKLFLL